MKRFVDRVMAWGDAATILLSSDVLHAVSIVINTATARMGAARSLNVFPNMPGVC